VIPISVTVNGSVFEEVVPPRLLLSDFLRHSLGLTGTHVGCEHGVCGSCTVIVDGASVRSCLMLAVQVDSSQVMTIEALATGDALHPLQTEFRANHALQCGFCTPGILMAAVDFLEKHDAPTPEEIAAMLSGHLCRCTGYTPIIESIHAFSRSNRRRSDRESSDGEQG
jgi:aerobic-type carbon monoxide dehydrogenase small subunit (CoxS/CutS family)